MTNENVVHIISTPQHLLGRLADMLQLDLDAPHALCGVSLVDRSEPPAPDPSPDAPVCPACRARNVTMAEDGTMTASELSRASIRAHIANQQAATTPLSDCRSELLAKHREEVDAWWKETISGGDDSTWCVHVHGPDDVLPAASRRDAILRANQMNTAMVTDHLDLFDEDGMAPAMWAVPALRKDVS